MSQQVAYAVALSIVGLSGASAFAIITQAGRLEKIQADLSAAKITIKMQPPKKKLLSSHEELRALLYLSSTNLYSALQSIDSISATVQADKSMSSLQLQVKLDQILTKACQDDPQIKRLPTPHANGDLFQIHVHYIGYVNEDVTDTRRQSLLITAGSGSGFGSGCHDYQPHPLNVSKLNEFGSLLNWADSVPLSRRRRKLQLSSNVALGTSTNRQIPPGTAAIAVDTNLLMFHPKVSQQRAQDFLDSDQFAQLAADYVIEKAGTTQEENQIMWYREYIRVLKQVGWVVADSDYAEFDANGASFSVDKVLLKVLAAVATDSEVQFVGEVLSALSNGSGGDQFTLWEQHNSSSNNPHFNAGVGYVDAESGEFHVGNSAVQIRSSTSSTGFLFFHYSSTNTHLQHATTNMRLNERTYSRIRDTISDRLVDHGLQAAMELPLAKI